VIAGATQVLHLRELDSTQDLAKSMAESGAPEGTIVRADRQTRGRGRLERTWDSKDGGLYFSLVLRPRFAPARLADFGVLAAEAIAEAVTRLTRIETWVKPPNDVYVEKSKLSGVLAEASGNGRSLDWLVVGVGVNVNNRPPKGGTSLKVETGKALDVDRVLSEIVSRLNARYRRFQ
jgi:BirA family transcriptional regulator, biotin operon repressor / biotin---[acetyl-CoA-carboxylase] ligase